MEHSIFRALHYRNFRLFAIGQGISLVGTWMQQVAMSWLVYRLTGSALLLGTIAFCNQFPAFVLSPFAGVFADRWRKQRVLLLTQTLMMIQAAILSALVLGGTARVWEIVCLSIFSGSVNALDIPVRHSFFIDMISDKADLANAIALNSSLFSGARLVGPAVAGAVIAAIGEGACFVLNSVSFLAVIIALAMIRVKASPRETSGSSRILQELREGVSYAWYFAPMRTILLMLVLISLMGMPYAVLMPVFAKDIFHGGANTYGLLMTMSGVGAFTGALYLASRRTVLGLWKFIGFSAAAFGAAITGLSLSRIFWLSMLFSLVAGLASTTQIATSNTLLQTIVDNDKRGRVMSLYSMAFMGSAPFGSLLAGSLAHRLGAPDTLLLGGCLCIIGAVVYGFKFGKIRARIRPVYQEMGLLPVRPEDDRNRQNR